MEIIDAYCGIGPWMKRDRLLPWQPDEILGLLDHFGIARALAHSNFASGGGNAWHGNAALAEDTRTRPRFTPAFTLAPFPHRDSPQLPDFLDAMRQAGAKAVWLLPAAHLPLREIYGDILDACVAHRLPVLLNRELLTPADIFTLVQEWPGLRLVLAGCGYGEEQWLFPLLRRAPELRVCTGHYYIPPDAPHRFLAEFPPDRLVFGSGLPFFSPGGMIAHLMYADIPDDRREAILGGTIRRLLGEVRL